MKLLFNLLLFTVCFAGHSFSQDNTALHIRKLTDDGMMPDKGWKLQAGDNSACASPGLQLPVI